MKTKIYVDGYNFYYGVLEKSTSKWLDILSLIKAITHSIKPKSDIDCLYFFTSHVKANLASNGIKSVQSQNTYLKALSAVNPNIEVILGYHDIRAKKAPVYDETNNEINRSNLTKIWHIEEKKTDVNIGIHIVRDAIKRDTEQIIIVSNDTDLAPAIEMAQKEYPDIITGIIFPIQNHSDRQVNTELDKLADWTRKFINAKELEDHQLPDTVPKPNGRGSYKKPDQWK